MILGFLLCLETAVLHYVLLNSDMFVQVLQVFVQNVEIQYETGLKDVTMAIQVEVKDVLRLAKSNLDIIAFQEFQTNVQCVETG